MTRTASAQLRTTHAKTAPRRAPQQAPVTSRRPRPPARPAVTAAASGQTSPQVVAPLHDVAEAKELATDDFGVIWLDCGGRPVREALTSLVHLAVDLEGIVTVLDQSTTYVVALVKLPRASFARFQGALMLAGGQVIEGGSQSETTETVFLVSQSAALVS